MTIEELLLKLGSTPDEVANTLKTLRFKGKIGSDCDCPIANYLANAGYDNASVGWDQIVDEPCFEFKDDHPVKQFIIAFDENKYPELVEPSDIDEENNEYT
jgi:hypothetical protein